MERPAQRGQGAPGVGLDKPEAVTGPWEYPPSAKLDRLLRECRVPIGLLCSEHELRLVVAPHGAYSGALGHSDRRTWTRVPSHVGSGSGATSVSGWVDMVRSWC